MGEKLIFQACLALTISCLVQGCFLDRSGLAPNVLEDSGIWDAGEDAMVIDDGGQDSGTDAGVDAQIADAGDSGIDPEDAGTDAGTDAGADGGSDAGMDSGMDAGPPRVLTFEFERVASGGPVRSFWVREGTAGSWRSVGCVGGILMTATNTWQCQYDMAPAPSRLTIRFYADFSTTGVSPSCGGSDCSTIGTHRIIFDGAYQPPADISEESPTTTPFPPAGEITVKLYVTPL